MASLGLPGLAGFWGEFPAILSAYSPGFGLSEPLYRTLMVIAAVGTVLAAAYLLWLYQRTAFGEPTAEFAGQSDAEHGVGHGHVAHSLSSAANDRRADGGDEHHDDIHDVGLTEWIAWSPFLIAIVVFGVYPQLMFKIFDPAVIQMLDRMKVSLGK